MGALVAPSITERTVIFVPLQFVTLPLSWTPTRLVFKQMLGSDQPQSASAIQHELGEALRGLASNHAISIIVLCGSLFLQIMCHHFRRVRWLRNERSRLNSEPTHANSLSVHEALDDVDASKRSPSFRHRAPLHSLLTF